MGAVTYRQRSTHAYNLHRLLKAQQLGSYELQKIAAVVVIHHVQLI